VDEPTFRVSELTDAIAVALDVCFPDEVWVQGEISSLRRSSAGHVYFQLIEPGAAGSPPIAQLAVTLFAGAKAAVNATLREGGGIRMTDGVEIRLRGRVSLYGPQGRLQLRMTAVDPEYTLGRLAGDRERLLRALASEGMLDRNGTLPLPLLPLRVGLVTSRDSAAEADFLHELTSGPHGFQVLAVDARVQGAGADERVATALHQLAALEVDVIALVRGGGARTDLATFDSEVLARAIAGLGVPVLTGIGHEIDRSVADEVAHAAAKTPTACAALLVARADSFHSRVDGRWAAASQLASNHLAHAERRLHRSATGVTQAAQTSLRSGDHRLGESVRRLGRAAPRTLERAALHLDVSASRVAALDPARALARGWSITRTADGKLVTAVDQLRAGDTLVTTLVDGQVASQVLPGEAAATTSPTAPNPDAPSSTRRTGP
jgi:exodeoxyribonuclease VII large subunit